MMTFKLINALVMSWVSIFLGRQVRDLRRNMKQTSIGITTKEFKWLIAIH